MNCTARERGDELRSRYRIRASVDQERGGSLDSLPQNVSLLDHSLMPPREIGLDESLGTHYEDSKISREISQDKSS